MFKFFAFVVTPTNKSLTKLSISGKTTAGKHTTYDP